MVISCFADPAAPPGPEELDAALADSQPLWAALVHLIEVELDVPGEWNFGGKKYGWNRWYRKGGKALTSLYPQSGGLVAQVVLGREQVEQALAQDLGAELNRLVRETPRLHDGMWLFIPVRSAEVESGVAQLLRIKRPPRKIKRAA